LGDEVVLLTLAEAEARYGRIENGVWPDEGKWCSIFQVPDDVAEVLINAATGLPTHHIYCNVDIQGPLSRVFQKVVMRGLLSELQSFDGCFMIRDIRGLPGQVSTHAYALAVDINASVNQLGKPPTMSPDIVKCFEEEGFIWGGDFRRRDGMHFQFANW
jgi:hypothetical protein